MWLQEKDTSGGGAGDRKIRCKRERLLDINSLEGVVGERQVRDVDSKKTEAKDRLSKLGRRDGCPRKGNQGLGQDRRRTRKKVCRALTV